MFKGDATLLCPDACCLGLFSTYTFRTCADAVSVQQGLLASPSRREPRKYTDNPVQQTQRRPGVMTSAAVSRVTSDTEVIDQHKTPHSTNLWGRALAVLSCATLLIGVVALVSVTPQLQQQTEALRRHTLHSCTLIQSAPAFSTAIKMRSADSAHTPDRTLSHSSNLAPLLGANEGLLRPIGTPAFELNKSTLLESLSSVASQLQSARTSLSHAWPSCESLKSHGADSTAHTQLAARVASANRLYEDSQLELAESRADTARLSEENEQLSAHLLAAVRQLSAAGVASGLHQTQHGQPGWRLVTLSAAAVLLLLAGMGIGILMKEINAAASNQTANSLEDVQTEVSKTIHDLQQASCGNLSPPRVTVHLAWYQRPVLVKTVH